MKRDKFFLGGRMELSIEKREQIIDLLNAEYVIPEEMIECVKDAVKKYSTKNYTDEVIDKIVRTPQSLSKGLVLLRERNGSNDLSLFRGILTEWLVCAEYNALKNKGAVVMTITNPDPSSKADLLHIIKIGNDFKVVPGPDVKSGSSRYVFNQWKKIVQNRYEIPMVDVDGILTTEEGLRQLTKKQREQFEELKMQFPKKQAIATTWNKEDISRVIADYLKLLEFEIYPSTESDLSIKDVNVNNVKAKLYSQIMSNNQTYDWSVFSSKSTNLFKTEFEDSSIVDNIIESHVTQSKIDDFNSSGDRNRKNDIKKLWNTAKVVGSNGLKFGKKVAGGAIKFLVEHPDIAITIGTAIIKEISNNSSNRDDYCKESNFESTFEFESDQDVNDTELFEPIDSRHASKHIRNLPEGYKASAEKIATAEANGFKLEDGQTWVDEY